MLLTQINPSTLQYMQIFLDIHTTKWSWEMETRKVLKA
jgi:hypothetical protein